MLGKVKMYETVVIISVVAFIVFLILSNNTPLYGSQGTQKRRINWSFPKSNELPAIRISRDRPVAFHWIGQHNVYKFDDLDSFGECDFTRATLVGNKSGTIWSTDKPTISYFGCGVRNHCAKGMKMRLVTD